MAVMPQHGGRGDAPARGDEDVAARAARLGISDERILRELARVAFANIGQIVGWDADGIVTAKAITELSEDDLAAVAEVVASASTSKIYRVKMHDKKPALATLARCVGLLPLSKPDPDAEEETDGADPRELLIREVDRIRSEMAARSGDPEPQA
jgi:hypothetical protein